VARGIFGNILKTRGLLRIFMDCGLISQKGEGLTTKSAGIFQRGIFFNGKYDRLGPPFVDRARCRSTVDRGQGLGGGSPELSLVAAPGHDGSPTVAQRKEGCMGNSMGRSLEIRQQRGGWVTVMKKQWRRHSVQVVLGCAENRRAGRGAVENDRALPLYRG
jgi:hypothetical protein